jgi:hypothetical protein
MPPPGPGAAVATNGFATASLVLGIIGLVMFWAVWVPFVLGILAIVFGAIGRSRAKQGAPNGGLATAGLVLGIVSLVIAVLFFVLFFAALSDGTIQLDTGPTLGTWLLGGGS